MLCKNVYAMAWNDQSGINVADMYSCKVVKIEELMNIRYYEYTVVFMIYRNME